MKNLWASLSLLIDRCIHWDRLPKLVGLLVLIGIRTKMRATNLYSTETERKWAGPPKNNADLVFRSADGTFNDLSDSQIGAAYTRFGRNVPLAQTWPKSRAAELEPNPRLVSRELLTRERFEPAPTLNVLAAAWLQFMIRDWFSHGKSPEDDKWLIPLPPGDTWHQNPMEILRTASDTTRTPADSGTPPTYLNTETHWWDASQIYGSTAAFQQHIRTMSDGKLHVGPKRTIAPDAVSLVQNPTLAGWWLGQEIFFSLFTLEHNAICDRLRAAYPEWPDEDIFGHARLINAAVLAKIHTVEWSTAILGHPTLQIALRTNWWGIAMNRVHDLVGRLSPNELISGIPGSATDDFGVPYAITEEFVAVYRMHQLIPDDYKFYSVGTGAEIASVPFTEIAGAKADVFSNRHEMTDILYSFGIAAAGAVKLHNYPRSLQTFTRPDGRKIDLAAHDILRSRELGVPRYNRFRRLLHLSAPRTFEELTDNPAWASELRAVYNNDIESVDLSIGLYAEKFPKDFGFSDTAFRIFLLMASRRLNSDRFFTVDFTPEIYTPLGMKWIDEATFSTVLLRHYPGLKPALRNVENAFAPWTRL